jgi:putative transposase
MPGRQYTAVTYSERLAEIGATPSIGSIGDSYDCDDRRVLSRSA